MSKAYAPQPHLGYDPKYTVQKFKSKLKREMVKHHTVARRFNPVRSKKRRSRRRKSRYSERTKTDITEDKCFTITLRDVGDIDDKELNTVPSSVQGETSPWADTSNNSLASYTNPLLQVGSADFCQLCTKKLLDIHDNDGGMGDVCDHEENGDKGRRQHVKQSIVEVFQSIAEGIFDESTLNIVQSKMNAEQDQENSHARLMKKRCQTLSKAINTSNREMAKCSLSRLSIQVMCTSESTLSTALSQDPNPVALWPQQEKHNPESIVAKKKLETVAGALLMELCKVTADKIEQNAPPASQKKLLLAKDSYMPRLKNARQGRPATGYSALEAGFPDWWRELCQQEDSKVPKRGILKKARSQIEKSKINIFRPLLCTKLSIPWLLPKSLPQIACKKQHELDMLKRKSSSVVKHSKNQHQRSNKDRKRESKKENSNESARRESKCSEPASAKVHAYDTRNDRCRSSDAVPFEGTPSPTEVPLRLFASKTIREVKSAKKKRAERREDRDSIEDKMSHRYSNSHHDCRNVDRLTEKRVKEICPKCQSSIQWSIALRRNSPKLRKIKTKAHNVLAYPCKKIVKKTKPSSRQEKGLRQQLERSKENGKTWQYNRDPSTKYFIKSFFTGTSTSETTKPAVKTIKKVGRRKKIVPPRTSGRAIPHDAKKRRASPTSRSPRRHHAKVEKEDSDSDIELEIQASEEIDIINQHIMSHKTASGSSPVFHTCFKRLLDKELKAQQSGRDSKLSRSRKISKGGYFFGRPPPEVKRFNEGIFSCLIPKVFK